MGKKTKKIKKNLKANPPWKFREDVDVTYDEEFTSNGKKIPVTVIKKRLPELNENWDNPKTGNKMIITWVSCFGIKNKKTNENWKGKVPKGNEYTIELDSSVLTKYSNNNTKGILVYKVNSTVHDDLETTTKGGLIKAKLDEGDPPIGIAN